MDLNKQSQQKFNSNLLIDQSKRLGLASVGLISHLNLSSAKQFFNILVSNGEHCLAKDKPSAGLRGLFARPGLNDDAFDDLSVESERLSTKERIEFQALAETKVAFEKVTGLVRHKKVKVPKYVALELYALFKQAKHGNVTGKRPPMTSFAQRAKYDAWLAKANMGCLEAMQAYIGLAEEWVLNPRSANA